MPVHEAEAIVLRQYSLSEADKIIVLVTREFGKVRATAQGVKKPRSRLAAALEPLNHLQLQFYSREGAELARIRQAETLHSYLGRNPTLERICAFTYFAELVQEFVEEGNPNPLIFRLLLSVLKAGEGAALCEALVRYFEVWILRLNGSLPNYDYCSNCGRYVKDEGFFAWPEAGQGLCQTCAGGKGVQIRPECSRLLGAIFQDSPERFVAAANADPGVRGLERLTQKLLMLQLEKQIKSYKSLRNVLAGGVE
ncbi:MAG TPA: DNA repair protein RecO [Acidobacteriota bacterium]|nr:DNA repair protein RecO [Acidobacteriota bacterium]